MFFNLPRERLARFKQLVPAWWVNSLLKGEKPPHPGSKDLVICHAHYRNPEAYLSGHIPGAIGLDTLALESPDTWSRRSPQELEQALLSLGITADTTVVLYGKFLFPDNEDDFPGLSCLSTWLKPKNGFRWLSWACEFFKD